MGDANLVPSPETGEVGVFKPHVDVFDAIVGNHVSWVLWFENEDIFAFRTDDSSDALLDNLLPIRGLAGCTPTSLAILVGTVASNVNSVIVCKGSRDHLTAILRSAIEVRELRLKLESRIDKERNQLLGKAA